MPRASPFSYCSPAAANGDKKKASAPGVSRVHLLLYPAAHSPICIAPAGWMVFIHFLLRSRKKHQTHLMI